MTTKFVTLMFVIFLALAGSGCTKSNASSAPVSDKTESVPADGIWTSSEEMGFDAVIKNNRIIIQWSPDETSQGLYWDGSFDATMLEEGQTITSKGNREELDRSMYGSLDETKAFEIKNGEIHFVFAIAQTTHNIVLSKEGK